MSEGGSFSNQYRQLFDAMSEGFALVDAIRDNDGALVDYHILEINPALQRMLGVGPEVAGRKLSDGGQPDDRWLKACELVLKTGQPLSWDFFNPATARTHEIRLNPVGANRIAQFFFDVTEREAAKARQAQLFDEMNHRVMNSLMLVSSLLDIQARSSPIEEVKRELSNAVHRVRSIADIHGSLYRGQSNDRIAFDSYLKSLCEGIAASMLDPQRVTIELSVVPIELELRRATYLGMAVNELVTNAAKYAYPPPQVGIICVGLSREDDGFTLSVRDEGIGLSDELSKRGTGTKLLQTFVQHALGSVTRRPGPGTGFTISIPVDKS